MRSPRLLSTSFSCHASTDLPASLLPYSPGVAGRLRLSAHDCLADRICAQPLAWRASTSQVLRRKGSPLARCTLLWALHRRRNA
jgi:hypothetical protein